MKGKKSSLFTTTNQPHPHIIKQTKRADILLDTWQHFSKREQYVSIEKCLNVIVQPQGVNVKLINSLEHSGMSNICQALCYVVTSIQC